MTEHPHLVVDGHRATITLNRPDKHNVLEVDDIPRFRDLLDKVAAAPEVRVLVITGTGEKTFCSGINLGDIEATDWRENPLEGLCNAVEALKVPTIAALNGGVYGGAADLALACDFRIGVEGMKCRVPPARIGLIYNVSGMRRFVERLGLGPAKRLLMSAETMADRTLLDIGFADFLVARGDFAATVDELADRLSGLAPGAVQGMKKALNGIARGTLDVEATERAIVESFRSEDLKEGLAAMAEKRAPNFTGR